MHYNGSIKELKPITQIKYAKAQIHHFLPFPHINYKSFCHWLIGNHKIISTLIIPSTNLVTTISRIIKNLKPITNLRERVPFHLRPIQSYPSYFPSGNPTISSPHFFSLQIIFMFFYFFETTNIFQVFQIKVQN